MQRSESTRTVVAMLVSVVVVSAAAEALDGTVLAVESAEFETGNLIRIDCATRAAETIVGGGGVFGPSFSPDSTKAAFSQSGAIYIVDLDGTNKTYVTDCSGSQVSCTWTETGYIYWGNNTNTLYRVNVDGTGKEIVHSSTWTINIASFSMDGTRGSGSVWTPGPSGWDVIVYDVGDPSSEYVFGGCQGAIAGSGNYFLECDNDHRRTYIRQWDDRSVVATCNAAAFATHQRYSHRSDDYFTYRSANRPWVHHVWSDTAYDMEYDNASGSDYTPIVFIANPNAVRINSFAADPASIAEGGSSTLSWQTTNATTVTISQGVGTVPGAGSTTVSPAQTTTYTLTAGGDGGPVTSTVTVAVAGTGDPELVGWWRLDDGSGTTAADSSGNGNDGDMVGGPTWTTGYNGGALQFDGTDDHVTIDPIIAQPASFTISAWIKTSYTAPAGTEAVILAWGAAGQVGEFRVEDSKIMYGQYAGGADWQFLYGGAAVSDNAWHHVALTKAGSAINLYVDAIPDGSGSITNTITPTDLTIGAVEYLSAFQHFFNGLIDDVRLYNRALDASEIADLHSGSDTTAPVVAITTPADGASVYDTVSIEGTASDDVGVDTVEVSVDGGAYVSAVGTADWGVWTHSIDATLLTDGNHTITARATDTSGNVTTASVTIVVDPGSTTQPSLTLVSPTGGEVWYVGTTPSIQWVADNLSNVALFYSVDGGPVEVISTSVLDTMTTWGLLPWTVPDEVGTNVVVYIQGYMGEVPTQSGPLEIRAVIDADGDGMDDGWEAGEFGDLSHDQTTDADGDGFTDYQEFMAGTDPTVADGGPSVDAGSCTPAAGGATGAATFGAFAALLAAAAVRRRARRGATTRT